MQADQAGKMRGAWRAGSKKKRKRKRKGKKKAATSKAKGGPLAWECPE
jgi:hypothetical protein